MTHQEIIFCENYTSIFCLINVGLFLFGERFFSFYCVIDDGCFEL